MIDSTKIQNQKYGRPLKIIANPGLGNAFYQGDLQRGLHEIRIDPNYRPQFLARNRDGSITQVVYSEFRILAHELGHGATGACDPDTCWPPVRDPGPNVWENENPVVMERGLRERYSYYAPTSISNPIDEEDEWGLS